MFAALISPDDCRWSRVLARVPHDVYHVPEYTALAAKHEGGVPMAFYAESAGREMLCPLLLREVPQDLEATADVRDLTSPYGYPGPLITAPHDAQWVDDSFAAFKELARRTGLISAFVRLHPLVGLSAEAVAAHGIVVYHGPVVYIDLTKPPKQLDAETRENHRRDIARLHKLGFAARVDDWSLYNSFRSLYRSTMQRVAAAKFYFFSDTYFEEVRHALKHCLHFCVVVAPNGDLAAAGLFTQTDGIVEYHLGGSAEPYLRHAASKLMFYAIRQWARASGYRLLNLGGGVGGQPGPLLNFKAGFSRLRAPYHTLRVVFDTARYEQLTRLWRARAEDFAPSITGFFPDYRQPLQRSEISLAIQQPQ
jgi:Acetyltransferase (GNAT) domain